jgi:predicted transposase YbfD/YdcC
MNYNMLAQQLPQDRDGVLFDVGSLYARFLALPDPRKRRGRRYPLALVLLAMFLAKLAGQDTPAGMAAWVRLRTELFVGLFQLTRARMPHAATYRRVASQPAVVAEMERVGQAFLLSAPGAGRSPQVTLDGKKLHGVAPTADGAETALLAVFLPAEGLVLRQVAVAEKSNEIPAAPVALQGLDLQGKVVTADALHTQRELSQAVVAAGADYVWIAKENQPALRRDIVQLFQPETCLPGTSPVITDRRTAATTDKGHGRIETRRLTASSLLAESSDWPHLAQVFQLERTITHRKTGARHTEVVYGLTSLAAAVANPERLLALVRGQWGIESQLHWRRDVLFHEDQTRTCSPLFGQAIACLNNLVLGLAWRLGWRNLAQARRHFDAHPDEALRALMTRLA